MASVEELKQRFETLTKKRDELTSRKVVAESRLQVATENYDKAIKEIKEKFGVSSLSEAQALYERKKSELETALNKCELELGDEDAGGKV